MFLEWWMIGILALFWAVSVISHGRISFESGATAVVANLQEQGYIKITKDAEIIGLCNQDQDNHLQ